MPKNYSIWIPSTQDVIFVSADTVDGETIISDRFSDKESAEELAMMLVSKGRIENNYTIIQTLFA